MGKIGFVVGWFVLKLFNYCWIIMCRSKFNNYDLQLHTVQKYNSTIFLNKFNNFIIK